MSQFATASAPEVLVSIADELDHAGELCDRLETLVTRLVRATHGEPLAIALHEAQTLDVLVQHLAALASFARRLSDQAGRADYDLNDAVAGVTLSDLANRLARATQAAAPAETGDLELF